MKIINSGLGNYYGEVVLRVTSKGYYLELEDYNGTNKLRVTEEFAKAFIEEFKEE
jgi:hypothetical protein